MNCDDPSACWIASFSTGRVTDGVPLVTAPGDASVCGVVGACGELPPPPLSPS